MDALETVGIIVSRLAADPAMARLFSVGVRDASALTPEARLQLTWIFHELFGGLEFVFDQARAGTLPPDVWDRWSKTLSWWVALPGVQAWWKAKPVPFGPRFTDCVDGRLAEPDVDLEAVARWQAFLWGAAGEQTRWHFRRARPPDAEVEPSVDGERPGARA